MHCAAQQAIQRENPDNHLFTGIWNFQALQITATYIQSHLFNCVTGYLFGHVTTSLINVVKNNNGGNFLASQLPDHIFAEI